MSLKFPKSWFDSFQGLILLTLTISFTLGFLKKTFIVGIVSYYIIIISSSNMSCRKNFGKIKFRHVEGWLNRETNDYFACSI